MSLEELLRSRVIRRIRPNHKLAVNSIIRANRDIDTARTLVANNKFDWALAVSYNSMLTAGRALMYERLPTIEYGRSCSSNEVSPRSYRL